MIPYARLKLATWLWKTLKINSRYVALDAFFEALIGERDTQVIHIAHYGDSQIEGDRVTSVIRRNLQANSAEADWVIS